MTNTVLIKRSGTANSVPTAGQLNLGELAINYTDGNLFYKTNGGSVTTIASNKFVSVTGNITGANLNAVGLSLSGNVISALNVTGNVAGNYFIGNGSLLTGVVLSNSDPIVTTGNVTGGNLLTVGLISATGNITGSYFIGNGSQLTGISGGSTYATITVDNFTGNGSGTTYTLSVTPDSINQTTVNYNGVTLIRGEAYTLSGANIVLSSAAANASQIQVTTLTGVQINPTQYATTGKAIAMSIVFGG